MNEEKIPYCSDSALTVFFLFPKKRCNVLPVTAHRLQVYLGSHSAGLVSFKNSSTYCNPKIGSEVSTMTLCDK